MEHEAQLTWEARAGRRVGIAAFGAIALPLVAALLPRLVVGERAGNVIGYLTTVAARPGLFAFAYVLQVAGIALSALVLLFLFRAARYRRPQTPAPARVLAIAGPLLYATVVLASQLSLLDAARDFVASGPRTQARAQDIVRGGVSPALLGARLAASLALGFAFLLVSRSAMQAGIISRFMGFLGIAVGLFYLVPLFGAPDVLQAFWVGAVGLLALDRWPGGRGPAWSTGEAAPWPTSAEVRARRHAEAEEERPEGPADRSKAEEKRSDGSPDQPKS